MNLDGAFAVLGLSRPELDRVLSAVPLSDPKVWEKRTELLHQTIKRKHHELMLQYHPDRNPNGLEKTQEINAAATLLDNVKVGPPQPPPMMMVPTLPIIRIVVGGPGCSPFGGFSSATTSSVTWSTWPGTGY